MASTNQSGFHPIHGCLARLKEHQDKIDTNFYELRTAFAKGFPTLSPAWIDALLASIVENAPTRLRELKQQLADCLHWELQRHGQHICNGIEVSERTIRALYAELSGT